MMGDLMSLKRGKSVQRGSFVEGNQAASIGPDRIIGLELNRDQGKAVLFSFTKGESHVEVLQTFD